MAYVYRHIRLDKNEPFYIGIGEIGRRSRVNYGRNKYWKNIAKLTPYDIDILRDGLTWEQAIEKEVEFIELYGRKDLGNGTLVNMTNGGDGRLTHNFCKYPLFNTWNNIRKVCYSVKHKKYPTHGGKGVKMCAEWVEDFLQFYKWAIDNGWEEGKMVARKNKSKDFDELNCIILNNRKEVRDGYSGALYLKYKDELLTLHQAAIKYNVPRNLIYVRIRKGWNHLM